MALLSTILAQVAVPDSAIQPIADSAAAVADTVAAAVAPAAQAAEPVVKELSVWNLTMAGGWLMIPLALLLPLLFGLKGLEFAQPVGDALTMILAVILQSRVLRLLSQPDRRPGA